MSMISSGEEQSEDGELRQSPQELKQKREPLAFSLSEEDGEALDALDIKPPQARIMQQASKTKRREGHDKAHHKRSERHRTERHFHREKHHREKSGRSAKEREHSQREKDRYYRETQGYEQQYVDPQYLNDRVYRERKEEQARSSRHSDSRKYEEKKAPKEAREITYNREEKHKTERFRADKALHDLRQRLLSKRTGKGDEEYVEEVKERRYRTSKSEDEEYVVEKEETYRRYTVKKHETMDVALQGEAGAYVKEIINISTSEERRSRKDDRPRDDEKLSKEERTEQEQRREKLLEAEREMARVKEHSRLERERRHLERATKRRQEDEANLYQKRQRTDEANIVTVSDNSESEIEDDEYEEAQQKSDRSQNSSSSSNHSRASDHHNKSNHSEAESVEASPYSERSRSKSPSPSRISSDKSGAQSDRSATVSPPKSQREEREVEEEEEEDDEVEKVEVKEAEKEEKEVTKIDESLPPYYPAIQGCRSVVEFQSLNRIEEGTYGVVYRARDKRTEEIVALKRLKMEKEKEGFPITSLREINTLLKGQHPNIVTVREIVVGSNMDKIFIVMDYVEHDLKSLMETMRHKKQNFMPGEIKCLLKQLLCAVAHLHDNWILHRDLKTSNLLLSHKGILKVGDFGLAREYGSPLKAYTPIVVTLWYRAPELLLCTKEYSTPIDLWSVGCIFGEFLLMNALFPGKSEVDQLNRVFKDLGTPSEKIWPGFNQLPAVKKMKFTEYPISNLRSKFNTLSEIGLGMLIKFLTYDPVQRVTAEDALKHSYFNEPPLPIDPAMFPTWPAKSELGQKRALAASPRPPSAGGEFKKLGDDAHDGYGFRIGMGVDHRRSGPGFNLKF